MKISNGRCDVNNSIRDLLNLLKSPNYTLINI